MLCFEIKKIIAQKKVIWIFLVVVLVTFAVFLPNIDYHEKKPERAQEWIESLNIERSHTQNDLVQIEKELGLNEQQQQQLNYLREMGTALLHWQSAIYNQNWQEYVVQEQLFLQNMLEYEKHGGQFITLQGMERDMAIAKNTWLMEHGLSYEDEQYPLSPHLVLTKSSNTLLGILGIAILLLFFGTTLTEEKEQRTWLTLKTQPVAYIKILVTKYLSQIIVSLTFIALVVAMGIIIPQILGEYSLELQYPKILVEGETFTIISTMEYLTRSITLFVLGAIFTFSLSILIGASVQKNFTLWLVLGATVAAGYFVSSTITTSLNPFYLLHTRNILEKLPQSNDWVYVITAIICSVLIMTINYLIPKTEINLYKSSNFKKPFVKGETKNTNILQIICAFEWRKVQREGLLKQLSIFLMIFIVVGYAVLSHQAQLREEKYMEYLKFMAKERDFSFYENIIAQSKEKIKEIEEDENHPEKDLYNFHLFRLEEGNKSIQYINNRLAKLDNAILAYEEKNWENLYEYQLFMNYSARGEFDTGALTSATLYPALGQFTIDVSIAEKYWLMERNIQPVFPGEYIPTIYQTWGIQEVIGWNYQSISQERWEYENTKVDSSGLFSLYLSFKNYIYFLPMALLLFLLGGGMANEKGKRPTINFYKTQPLTEKSIFMGKVINTVVIVIITCLLISLFLVLLGTVVNRFGDWEYPILHYNTATEAESPDYDGMLSIDDKGFHFITLGRYLLNSVTLFSILVIFIISISMLISIFSKTSLGVFASTILITIGGYWGSNQILENALHLSPFTYLDIPRIINGELATVMDNPRINIISGSIVLLVSSVLLLGLGYVILHRRNMKDKHGSAALICEENGNQTF